MIIVSPEKLKTTLLDIEYSPGDHEVIKMKGGRVW
jgi:hypothetical protein